MDQRDRLAGLLSRYDIDYYLAGDSHTYDVHQVTRHDFPSVAQPFTHVIMGGAGGRMMKHDPLTHFFLLFRVTPTGITHYLHEYDDVGIAKEELTPQNGSQVKSSVQYINTGKNSLQGISVSLTAKKQSDLVVIDNTGRIYQPAVRHAKNTSSVIFDTSLLKKTKRTFTLKKPRAAFFGVTNPYTQRGLIDLNALPKKHGKESPLEIFSTQHKTRVRITQWNEKKISANGRRRQQQGIKPYFVLNIWTTARYIVSM